MKQRVFVGSSSEGLEIAEAVQSNLEPEAEVRVSLDARCISPRGARTKVVARQITESDFGVFVFSPDDIVEMRRSEQLTVRDNVVFELGLCIGLLGAKRSFILMPKTKSLRIPSDLLGFNAAEFDPNRSDGILAQRLGLHVRKLKRLSSFPMSIPSSPTYASPS